MRRDVHRIADHERFDMDGKNTYRAVLYGPDPIGSGQEIELEYVDGAYREIVILDYIEDSGETIERKWELGEGRTEPIPYRFVKEHDSRTKPSVKN